MTEVITIYKTLWKKNSLFPFMEKKNHQVFVFKNTVSTHRKEKQEKK